MDKGGKMKIAIISDSHDHLENLNKAFKIINDENCEELIHCGDFCAPFMLKVLKEKFFGKIHLVFGNIDDRASSMKLAIENGIKLYGDLGEIEIDSKKIAFTHQPSFARGLAFTNDYDVVFHGHDHIAKKELIGKTLIVNPGEIMGRLGVPQIAIYDTKVNEVKHLEVI